MSLPWQSRQLHREAATAFTLAAFTQKLAALTKEETASQNH
jgi:hypothetical protein